MPVQGDTLRAFTGTEYRVRLRQGSYAVIRIGEPLPHALHYLLHGEREPWGFITAWNPYARKLSRAHNRERQRDLLRALQERGARLCAGVGVGVGLDDGENDWREPSLFVLGLDFDILDELARRFEQAALVRGAGHGAAELRVLL